MCRMTLKCTVCWCVWDKVEVVLKENSWTANKLSSTNKDRMSFQKKDKLKVFTVF